MKYSEYRGFRKRLDAGVVITVSWSELESVFEPASNDYGYCERMFHTTYTCRTMPLYGATIEQARCIFDRCEKEIREALCVGQTDNVEIYDGKDGAVCFEATTSES